MHSVNQKSHQEKFTHQTELKSFSRSKDPSPVTFSYTLTLGLMLKREGGCQVRLAWLDSGKF